MSVPFVKGNEVKAVDDPLTVLKKMAAEMTPRHSTHTSTAMEHVGPYSCIVVTEEATFSYTSVAGKPDPTSGTLTGLAVGVKLYGEFLTVTLVSGAIQLFNLGPQLGMSMIQAQNIHVNPPDHDYGILENSVPPTTVIIDVGNIGQQNLEISLVQVVGANAAQFKIIADEGFNILTPGQNRKITLSFEPVMDGDRTAFLEIHTNDPDTPLTNIDLVGLASNTFLTTEADEEITTEDDEILTTET